ncbi:MAG TPA: DUF2807 domain-containing protein [Anaerolineales bacterium]|nr:DUF2807 domain-containing protein [Anaerolineales bacterium]
MNKPRSLFGPLLLIAIGAIWLLTKSGSVPSANLWALTHVWPYILIAAGLGLILRSYWKYTSLLMDVVIVGGVVAAIFFAPTLGWDNPSMTAIVFDGDGFVGPGISGSGNIITETRDVEDFHSIEVDYPAQVFVTQGSATSVEVEADDNLLPGLQTRVRNGTLEVFYKAADGKQWVNPSKTVKVMIVVKELDEVSFSSAGDLKLEGVESDNLRVSVSGAGNLDLKDIDVNVLSVDLSGAGNVVATGDADEFNLEISGFGSFNGKDLHTRTADIEMSGAGSASIWVDDELDAQISGAGSVNYYGSPEVTKQVSGVGSVSRSGDK